MPQALFCRLLQQTAKESLEAKPLPLWALAPLWIIFKGVKTHLGTGKAGTIICPSAEADGKREPTARLHIIHR